MASTMRRLRNNVKAVLVVVTMGTLLGACRSDEIARNWESDEQKGGVATLLEIRPDKSLTSSLLVRIDRNYQIEGNKLTIVTNPEYKAEPVKQPVVAEKSKIKTKKPAGKKADAKQQKPEQDKGQLSPGQVEGPVVYELEFNNDSLKLTHEAADGSKEVLDLKRKEPPATPGSIIGHWTFRHQTGKTAHMVFNANGSMHFRLVLPFGTELTYALKDDTIMLYKEPGGKSVMTGTYKLEAGKFVLDDGKSITHFAPVDESKWGASQ